MIKKKNQKKMGLFILFVISLQITSPDSQFDTSISILATENNEYESNRSINITFVSPRIEYLNNSLDKLSKRIINTVILFNHIDYDLNFTQMELNTTFSNFDELLLDKYETFKESWNNHTKNQYFIPVVKLIRDKTDETYPRVTIDIPENIFKDLQEVLFIRAMDEVIEGDITADSDTSTILGFNYFIVLSSSLIGLIILFKVKRKLR